MSYKADWAGAKKGFEDHTGGKKPNIGFFSHATGIEGAFEKLDGVLPKGSPADIKAAFAVAESKAAAYQKELDKAAADKAKGKDYQEQVKLLAKKLDAIVLAARRESEKTIAVTDAGPQIKALTQTADAVLKDAAKKLEEMQKQADLLADLQKKGLEHVFSDVDKVEAAVKSSVETLGKLEKEIGAACSKPVEEIDKLGKAATPDLGKRKAALAGHEAAAQVARKKGEAARVELAKMFPVVRTTHAIIGAWKELTGEAESLIEKWDAYSAGFEKAMEKLDRSLEDSDTMLSGSLTTAKKLQAEAAVIRKSFDAMSTEVDRFVADAGKRQPKPPPEWAVKLAHGEEAAKAYATSAKRVMDTANTKRKKWGELLGRSEVIIAESFKVLFDKEKQEGQRAAFKKQFMPLFYDAVAEMGRHLPELKTTQAGWEKLTKDMTALKAPVRADIGELLKRVVTTGDNLVKMQKQPKDRWKWFSPVEDEVQPVIDKMESYISELGKHADAAPQAKTLEPVVAGLKQIRDKTNTCMSKGGDLTRYVLAEAD